MRILVINPILVSLVSFGACEQDRLTNIRDLRRMGHEVRVVTRTSNHLSIEQTTQFYKEKGVEASVLPPLARRLEPARLRDMAFIDGSAWPYGAPDFLAALDRAIDAWKPDLVWCHATYTWAPAIRAGQRHLPTVSRSVNYEPLQLSQFHWNVHNLARYVGKYLGERHALNANVLAAITPVEQAIYQQVNRHAQVQLLPLRTLADFLSFSPRKTTHSPLRVFFMGSSYNVAHNAAALKYIVTQIVPGIRAAAPGKFEFHILGGKVPAAMREYAAPDLIFAGYVPNLNAYLADMDIALSPRLTGVGMQQKLFEPLCRSFPTITHPQALVGYPFENGKHLITAATTVGYVDALLSLQDPEVRKQLSENARARAEQLFSRHAMESRTDGILQAALTSPAPR